MKKVRITKFSIQYKQDTINLLQHMWSDLTKEERTKRFEWRYEKNPFSDQPKIFIAISNDKVVGFRAFVVQNFVIKEQLVKVFSPADAIVNPDFRRMGIFKNLNDRFIEMIKNEYSKEECLILNLSSNQYSTPGCLKHGWSKTTDIKKYAYKVYVTNLLRTKLFKNKTHVWGRFEEKTSKYDIEISSNIYSKELGEFWQKHRNNEKFTNQRDCSFFEWRYTQESSNYCFAYLRKDNNLIAYIILKKIKNYQVTMEEYNFINPKAFKLLINKVVKRNKISILRTKIVNDYQASSLKKFGFFVENQLFLKIVQKKRLPVLVRPNVINPQAQDFLYYGFDIRDAENWEIFQADTH